MHHHDVWIQLNQVWRSMPVIYEPSLASIDTDVALTLPAWGLLLAVYKFEPESTTPGHLMVRNPFTAAEMYQERLVDLTAKGYLEQTTPAVFKLSPSGRKYAEQFITVIRQALADYDPLPPETGKRLADILARLVQASLDDPPPPNKWSIHLSYKIMPPPEPVLPYIEQALTCLVAYRDDAHLAAWRQSGLSAMALEVLTLLWRGEVASYEDICRKLAHRGHNCQVYSTVLRELQARELVDGPEEEPWITARGRWARNEIEENTDNFYFRPWSILNADEFHWLGETLKQVCDLIEDATPV